LALVGFSRLYVGVHSFDQLLTGWVLGSAISFGVTLSIDTDIRRIRLESMQRRNRMWLVKVFCNKFFLLFCLG